MKEPNLIIENLKAILEECTASEDAVSYVNGEDAGTLKAAIEALEKQERSNAQNVNSTHRSRPNALESLNILEQAKDDKGRVPMSLVRQVFRNILEQDRWIPVTERPPELNEEVLVTNGDGIVYHAEYQSNFIDEFWNELAFVAVVNSATIYGVKAWRPLPEPYTEEEV